MFACIYVPDFPVEAIVRAEPLLRERAVAVLEGKPPLVRVVALNDKARLLGMESGMTKLQAAVFAASAEKSSAVLRQRSPEQENSAHAALLDVAHAFTPRVEDTAADTLLLDLAGLERLYGAPKKMARDLAARVSATGLEANIALAANPDAAMHAARGFSGTTVIPAGKEAQRLGRAAVAGVAGCVRIFAEQGRQQGANAKSCASRCSTRWSDGESAIFAPWRCCPSTRWLRGWAKQEHVAAPGPRSRHAHARAVRATSHFEEAMELESPVETLEPLSFILNRLLEQLCARLEGKDLAAQELHLRLQLERRVADEETTTAQEIVFSSDNMAHNKI